MEEKDKRYQNTSRENFLKMYSHTPGGKVSIYLQNIHCMLSRPTTTLRGIIIEGEGKRRVFTFFFRWITLFSFHYLIIWINVNYLHPVKSPIIQLKTTHPESSSTKMPRSAWVNTARHLVFVFHQFPVQLTLGQHGFELHRSAYMRISFQ